MPAAHFTTSLMPLLSAVAIAMGRPAGAALVLPVFTRAQLGGLVRGAFAFVVGLPVIPGLYRDLQQTSLNLPSLALIGAREMMIGVIIGFLAGLPIWAVQSAGEWLDTQRSATQGQASEPDGEQESLSASLLAMTTVALYVTGNGLGFLDQAIVDSEIAWPPLVLALTPQPGFATTALGLLDRFEILSMKIAVPVILAMLLCDGCIILLMRAIPKLHLYDLAPTLRNLAFTLMMCGYASWLVVYARRDILDMSIMHDLGGLLAP